MHSIPGIDSSLMPVKPDDMNKPTLLEFSNQVMYVSFSPFSQTDHLAVIVFSKEMCIVNIDFKEEEIEDRKRRGVEVKLMHKIETEDPVRAVSWSPRSSLSSSPYSVILATTQTNNSSIKIISTALTHPPHTQMVLGHTSHVNAVSYDGVSGDCLASVGDDFTCRLWRVGAGAGPSSGDQYKLDHTFYLLSPGMSVCWHKSNSALLLVGEKTGTVRMYNVVRAVALLRFHSDIGNLCCVSWIEGANESYIAALCGSKLVIWNSSSPSVCKSVVTLHSEGGRHIAHTTGVTTKIFTLGAPDNTLKSTHLDKSTTKTISTFKLVSNVSCHGTLPYLAIGVDNTVQLWNTSDL